jgi:hypothetical protein
VALMAWVVGRWVPEGVRGEPLWREARAGAWFVIRRSAQGSSNEGRSVKLTRIKLHDKVKALDMLARHLGMFPMSERRRRRPTPSAR